MAYPISGSPYSGAAANPAYSGVFIPTLWSGKLIEKFYDATVLAAISNTDYAGEIKNLGDTVKIRSKPSITINTYQATQSLTVERPSSAVIDLLIDQGRYFNTVLDDVMEVQSDVKLMNIWSEDASEQMKINIDTYVLGQIDAGINAANKGATAGRIAGDVDLGTTGAAITVGNGVSDTTPITAITRLGQVLDEQNIPETGRWIVIPAWFAAMIKRSELRDASLSGDGTSIARNGRLGMIDRFTLYVSNLTPTVSDTGTKYRVFAGHSGGLTFASQLKNVETLRAESTFGTLMRGLQVFGFKVIDGTAVAELYCNAGT